MTCAEPREAIDALLSPIEIGGLRLRNRIAMAPMTREMSPGGVPTAAVVEYYRRRAAGGVGLIITEGSAPDAAGAFGASVPRFYGEDALATWANVIAAVHEEGAAIVPQLWHVGAFEPSLVGMDNSLSVTRVSPSGLASRDRPMGRAMTKADIDAAIDAFAAAAEAALRLGCDGIELHGAHGYLFDQFFWRDTNARNDAYGFADRTRFAVEVIRECKRRTGGALPIVFRISQWKQLDYNAHIADSPGELEIFLAPLVEAGVDIFHCSTRRFWEPAFEGDALTLAGWTKKLTGRPTILVGSVTLGNDFKSGDGKRFAEIDLTSIEALANLLHRGEFDIVAIGRALIANPDWPHLLAQGRVHDLRPFESHMLDRL